MASCSAAAALVAVLVVLGMVLPSSEAALTCSTVYQSLMPCLSYLQSGGAFAPSPECCSGIGSLMAAAMTTQDRRTACSCLKTAAAGISAMDLNLAGSLPQKCGVKVPYKISASTDCAKVN